MATESASNESTSIGEKRVMDADSLLAQLSALVNLNDASTPDDPTQIPITLTVGGTVITGLIISSVAWARVKAEEFSYFDKLPEWFRYEPDEEMTPELIDSISYIHLADAAIYHGAREIRLHYWRGLISRVDGWEIGRAHV